YILVLMLIAVVGFPLLWMLLASVKTLREIYTFPPVWIPARLRWENYLEAWQIAPFGRFYVNTIIMTFFGTLAKMVNGILSAYALSYLRFPRRDLVFLVILAALMIPPQVTILPNYLTLASLGWINTYQALILPEAGIAFGTFLLRQHFLTLPREILEAARVDGAGHLRILGQIVLPMSRPIVMTLLLLTAVGRWNDYLWPLIATTTKEMRTLPVGIALLLDQEGNTQWGQVMAATVMVIVPLLALFALTQRYLVEGATAGALKG
ncbi:MAG: carbohydrate ABC transporter permease, partial [Chloroflexi bacterium]|nr:carbohydrate ABC transporter permease [Chloroflexota bacterium]